MILANRFIRTVVTIGSILSAVSSLAIAQENQDDEGALPDVDPAVYAALTEAKLDCPRVSGAPIAGVEGCEDFDNKPGFKSDVISLVKQRFDKESELRRERRRALRAAADARRDWRRTR